MGQNSNSQNDSGAANQGQGGAVMIHTTIITIGSKTLQATQNQDGAWVVPDSSTTYTVSAGGSAVEVDAATLTAGNHGLVNMHTSVLTIGSKTLTGMQNSDGAWIVPDGSTTHTISQSGSAVEVDAATLTAGPDGLVDTHATTTTIGGQIVTYSQDSNGAWIIPDGTTTHTVSAGGSTFEMDGATLTAVSNGLVDMSATTTTINGQIVTYSQDSNGAWIIPDGTTTHTVSAGGSAFEMDGVTLTAGSGGLSDVHASKTGSNTRSSGASSTRGSQATSSSTSNSDSSASDTDASSAGHTTPRLTALALAFVALVFCAI
jgi:RNase P/RNase MRP subunit p29